MKETSDENEALEADGSSNTGPEANKNDSTVNSMSNVQPGNKFNNNSVASEGKNSMADEGTNSTANEGKNSMANEGINSTANEGTNSTASEGTNSQPDSTTNEGMNSVTDIGMKPKPDSTTRDGTNSASDQETYSTTTPAQGRPQKFFQRGANIVFRQIDSFADFSPAHSYV